jgi:ketosteroid isomerase-like protein
MKKLIFSSILICVTTICAIGQVTYHLSKKDSTIVEEIKRRNKYEIQLILRQDSIALKKFYPDDFVVTNAFNQFIDKDKVIERVKTNIIKYSSIERIFDYFKIHGNTVFVVGREIVVPTIDAARTDAGQTVHRRFTEVWMKRGNVWMKVLRHANNYVPE